MKHLISFCAGSFLLLNSIHAQEPCKVSAELLVGTYIGECVNGKANGKGKAKGIDEYEGEFKNGFPDGIGTYISAEKAVYKGSFKKGLMEGRGELTYTRAGGDSIVKGFWKRNKYVGEYEKPYLVNDRTGKVNKVDITIVRKNTSGTISLVSQQMSGSAFASSPTLAVVTDVIVMSGQYVNKNTSNLTKSSVLRLQQIIFPFRARFQFSNGEMVDVTFNESGDYDVNVNFL